MSSHTTPLVLDLDHIDRAQHALVGGKAAHLGELTRIDGVRVPAGFCVTTAAHRRVVAPLLDGRPDAAARRAAIEAVALPDDLAAAITARLHDADDATAAWAVRSSATAEDLPTASFAGQHDSSLEVVGPAAVLDHVRRCWASLFTDRAVAYRREHGIEGVEMAVVVQRMVAARAAGVLFTADPLTSNRRVAAVEAVAGLGEVLVSGRVVPDALRVRDDEVVGRSVAGTEPVLTDAEAVELVRLGRRIEEHLGGPQDVEWCRDDDGFHIVQSRPITTLFPIPETADDRPRVWLSTGHQQMMTDAMRPLGLSIWKLAAARPMDDAGGRLFVDVSDTLASPAARTGFLAMVARLDPLTVDALETLIERGFVPTVPDPPGAPVRPPTGFATVPIETDPGIVTGLVERNRASVAALADALRSTSGPAALDVIAADLEEGRRQLFDPESMAVLMAGLDAAWWLADHLGEWLGEPEAADVLTRSVPHDVTAEMGLALLDVADAIRPHPAAVALLEAADDDGFLDRLPSVPGGEEARAAIEAYLDAYGMRGVGEIDITRPRWREQPSALLPLILGNVRAFGPGEAARRVEQGRQAAAAKEREVLDRLRALPDGEARAAETAEVIRRLRTFAGYREYPKFGKISREALYKEALVAVAGHLVAEGVLGQVDDSFFLTFEELREVARTGTADRELIERRRRDHLAHQALTPPRVLTSEGEALSGSYRRGDVPDGALAGMAVSAGVVEGRARVILDLADADVEPGDILVTRFTDPSWSPLFVAVAGLVTEVGGVMTHGAVIAREYGLPAVVGVAEATRLVEDGQRIRVDGTRGSVELLPAGN